MCKNGSGRENEIQFKQNEVFISKDSQREGRGNIRTSQSREQRTKIIKYLGITKIEDRNRKGHIE